MKVFKQILLFLLVISLFSSIALAEIGVSVEAVNDVIKLGETAEFNVNIVNFGYSAEELDIIFLDDPRWSVETDPLTHLSGIDVPANSEVTSVIKISPVSDAPRAQYTYTVMLKSKNTGEETLFNMSFLFTSEGSTYGGYLPSLNMDIDIPEEIDPRSMVELKVNLINRNMLNNTDLEIDIMSDLFEANRVTTLAPLERKTEVFEIVYNSDQEPVTDMLIITVRAMSKTYSPLRKEIEIGGFVDVVVSLPEIRKSLFKIEEILVYTNNGNIEAEEEVLFETTLLKQLLSSTNLDPEVVEINGKRYFKWSLVIPADESVEIEIVRNYRPIIIALLLITLGIVGYYVFRSPVVVKKEAMILKKRSKVKVLIHVKNRTSKLVENVRIIDKLPQLTELQKEFEVGTLKPEKVIRHAREGTVIRWQLAHLEPHEERIITYLLNSKMEVIGSYKLPSTIVKFKNKKGKFVKIYSNRASTKK